MRRLLPVITLSVAACLSACGGGDDDPPARQFPENADMWKGLGGDQDAPKAIAKVVDDAAAGLFADPKVAPYFAVVGTEGHDSAERLTACLNLQFKALFGGPYRYPGDVQADGTTVTCEDMVAAHADLGIPGCVFDQFITDVATVLTANGVPDDYIQRVAPVLVATKGDVVSSEPVYLGPNTAENCK